MIIDSSALIAILRLEPERPVLIDAIVRASRRMVAAPTLLEASMVLAGDGPRELLAPLDRFIARASIVTLPFSDDHAAIARDAFLRYGKGRHPARLNFGDCIAYAVSKAERLPLLFKGGDFRLTDVEPAL
jgi:ribonuclease VapC